MYMLRSKPMFFWKSFLNLSNLFLLINYHNIEPIKFDILTDYLTVFVDCHDAPLGRAAHSARHAAALSCHRRDCFHLRVGNEKMWELDMILRLKSCNWHSVDKNYLIFWYLMFLEKLKIISKVIRFCDVHSSLVDYLAKVIYAKNCPTTFYYIFQLVWVRMTTTQNIRVWFLSSNNTLFS